MALLCKHERTIDLGAGGNFLVGEKSNRVKSLVFQLIHSAIGHTEKMT